MRSSFESLPQSPPQPFHSELRTPERVKGPDSKFGDTETYLEMMERLPAHVLGSARELLHTAPYSNEVDVVQFGHNSNDAKVVSFDSSVDGVVYGIFKPGSGENPVSKHEMGFSADDLLYPRECAAFNVSRHFGFDIVPPTTIREVNGELGSVQLLLEPGQYLPLREFFEERLGESIPDVWQQYLVENTDTDLIALFDYMIGGADRHMNNIMIQGGSDISKPDLHENLNLAAIDNGFSFNTLAFLRADMLYGPLVMRTTKDTFDDPEQQYSVDRGNRGLVWNVAQQIPSDLIDKLRTGLRNRDQLMNESVSSMIGASQIRAFWERVEELVKHGVFISPLNATYIYGY